ncbi:hypothetical protein [Rhizobium glycinendophyticum]|uniref:Uncharacterized protein n=1 Tax=Rhizobium glycinendophyticum TaxID=2589807 RepID=A0A504UMY2_9HYPH|nr:hypothetical protein [Rhizobium glycinendophyticum]TPP10376.1 hypothetical protein FJQ55_05830 [Rhizobium glycinendophyticum]
MLKRAIIVITLIILAAPVSGFVQFFGCFKKLDAQSAEVAGEAWFLDYTSDNKARQSVACDIYAQSPASFYGIQMGTKWSVNCAEFGGVEPTVGEFTIDQCGNVRDRRLTRGD